MSNPIFCTAPSRFDAPSPYAGPMARGEVTVAKDQLHRWTGDHRGLVLCVREGALWITQETDPDDVILRAGECFQVSTKGTVVAQGLASHSRLDCAASPS